MGACFGCCPVKVNPRNLRQKNKARRSKNSELFVSVYEQLMMENIKGNKYIIQNMHATCLVLCCHGILTKVDPNCPTGRFYTFSVVESEAATAKLKIPEIAHELLELDQKTGATAKMQSHSGHFSTNMSKPTRLVFRNMNTTVDVVSPSDASMPLLRSDNSLGDSCSHTGSQGWEHLGSGATPGSSVDLEWENEIGLTPPLNVNEELKWLALTETTNGSWQSSPISNNGLEWDGDFTTVDISTIISDTQHLISNIDDRCIETP